MHRDVFNKKIEEASNKIDIFFNEALEYCDKLDVSSITELKQFIGIYNTLDRHEKQLKAITVRFDIKRLKELLDNSFTIKKSNVEDIKNKEIMELSDKLNKLVEDKVNSIKLANEDIKLRNRKVQEGIDSENNKYKQLEVKRQRLLEYSQEILQLCLDYGIKISDINISNDMFTVDELDVFYDQFYKFIQSHRRFNPVTYIRTKLGDTGSIILLCIILLSMFTPLLDIASIFILLFIFYSQTTQESMVKKYTVLAGLVFNVNPLLLNEGLNLGVFEDELSTDIDIEQEPEMKLLLEEINKLSSDDSELEQVNVLLTNAVAEYTKDYDNMNNELDELIESTNNIRSATLMTIKELRESLKLKEEELMKNVKQLGYEFSESGVLSTRVKLGVDPKTFIYENIDIGMKNIILMERGNNPKDIDTFLKVLLTNYLCNVRPGFLDVTIYDPNNMGRSMAGFYNTELEQVFDISTKNLDNIIEDMREYTDKVIKTTKGMGINEYNSMMMDTGRITLCYKILVILSQPKSVEEDEALRKFIEYSADLGVFVWMVTNEKFSNTKVFEEPFENINQPIKINQYEFPITVMDNLIVKFKSLKSPSLSWIEFRDKLKLTKDTWSKYTDEFIELDPGFEDGDSSKFKGYTVGNVGDVHALVVGGTGAGKSVFINNLIINTVYKYSPSDLELWLVDFKGTEFNFFLKKPSIGQEYMLQQIAACLCTSDPDYSVSLFKALEEEANKRFSLLKEYGYKDMYTFNTAMRVAGTPEKCFKRLLAIVDEFQVIFEKTDSKAQLTLQKSITQISKVARAAGVHLLFCSQSMKGTIPADILNMFTLRFALRCHPTVSMDIMGTKFAGDIREKNGYLYVSSADDKKKELQKRYRTPFLTDKDLRSSIELLATKAIKENLEPDEQPITYEETTKHSIDELQSLYKNELSTEDVKGLFILGERMIYSNRGRRCNIFLSRENNQHLYTAFSNTVDAVMFFKTLMINIENNGSNLCIYNTQVKDLGYLCEIDKYINDTNMEFAMEGITPIMLLPIFKEIMEGRRLVDNPETLKPLYIILLGWDKSVGFGIDSNYKVTEAYSTLLQTCATFSMHFIFINSSQGDTPKSIITACSHRVAGKVDEKTSTTLLEDGSAYKSYSENDGYCFIRTNGRVERLKLYQSEITRKIKIKEIKI